MFDSLRSQGYQVEFLSHAQAILSVDFSQAPTNWKPPWPKRRYRSRRSLPEAEVKLKAHNGFANRWRALVGRSLRFASRRINDVPKDSQSHEIDHVRTFDSGARIALEIEWNNKDPFYDRDLENFKRLHADGAISVGIIVTRGKSLQDNMRGLVRRFIDDRRIEAFEDLEEWGYAPTPRQRREIMKRVDRTKNRLTFREAFTNAFVADKFGEATAHWLKFEY